MVAENRRVESRLVTGQVETTIQGAVDGPDIVAMTDDWKRLGATAVWIVDGSKVTGYSRSAMSQAVTLFKDHRLKTLIAVLVAPTVVMGAKTVAFSLSLANAADVRIVSTLAEARALARSGGGTRGLDV